MTYVFEYSILGGIVFIFGLVVAGALWELFKGVDQNEKR